MQRGSNEGPTLQSQLTEESFRERCKGYSRISPADLLDSQLGGQVRYAVDTVDASGRVASTQYRLGGTLTKVDPELRFFRLLNPYAHKGWSVQVQRPAGERLRVWYMPPGTRDEIIMFRKLLAQLENNEIQITRVNR